MFTTGSKDHICSNTCNNYSLQTIFPTVQNLIKLLIITITINQDNKLRRVNL